MNRAPFAAIGDAVSATGGSLLVDGHVHFHRCFTWKGFLDSAAANFARTRRALRLTTGSAGCLMLTESADRNDYRVMLNNPALARSAGWHVDKGDDGCSITLRRGAHETLIIVAGRQVATAEKLEVLALGTAQHFLDGRPLREVVRAVVESGAIAVIPWGFGKWLGRRGRILRQLIEDQREVSFCIGDNGGRPRALSRPRIFELAERHDLLVLGGSDPLPMPWQMARPGSYGFVLDAWQPTARPLSLLRTRIQALRRSPMVFGELSSTPDMIRSQLGIRLRTYHGRAGLREGGVA